MGILNRITDSQDETENEAVDYWCVRWMPFDSDGGFRSLEDWDEMENPVDRKTFEWNHPDPEPGRYRLFAVRESKYVRPPEELRWKWIVGEPNESEAQSDDQDNAVPPTRVRELEEKLDAIIESSRVMREPPEVRQERLRAKVMELALKNPHFMRFHGEKVALAAFDALGDQGGDPGFTDYQESPIGAGFYQLTQLLLNEPQKLKRIGQNAGAGVNGLLSGMSSETYEHDPAQQGSTSESEEGSTEEHGRPSAFDYDGPTTLADLDENGELEPVAQVEELENSLLEDSSTINNGTGVSKGTDGRSERESASEDSSTDDAERDAVENESRDVSADFSGESPSEEEREQRCQYVYPDGSQCENPVQAGSQYCTNENHSERETDPSSSEGNPSDMTDPSPEDVAEML